MRTHDGSRVPRGIPRLFLFLIRGLPKASRRWRDRSVGEEEQLIFTTNEHEYTRMGFLEGRPVRRGGGSALPEFKRGTAG